MIKIENSTDGRLQFVNDGCILQVTFLKIERVSPHSNYYCLWRNHEDEFFYLYNAATGKFALKTDSFQSAKTFSKIAFYSETTKSFVAVRSDKPYFHILFEDGYLEERTFNDVGDEYNNSRPVMVCVNDGKSYNEKWAYYDCKRRKLEWNIVRNGYVWDEEKGGGKLGRKLFQNQYEIIYREGYSRLCSYGGEKRKPFYSDDKFELLEPIGNTYIVGNMLNKNLFVLFSSRSFSSNPIGYYAEIPQYVENHNLLIARREENWCVIVDNKELSNYQWQGNAFVFVKNYIFNKNSEDDSWKIFKREDGSEVILNWRHIRVFDAPSFYMLVDTEENTNLRVTIKDIDREHQQLTQRLIEKSKNLNIDHSLPTECEEEKVFKKPLLEVSETKSNDSEIREVTKKGTNIRNCSLLQGAELPNRIDYYTSVDTLHIHKDGIISNNRKCNQLSVGNYVCWIVKDIKAIILSKYIRRATYKALYCKIVEDEAGLFDRILPTRISPIGIEGISEDTVIDMIKEAMPIETKCFSSVSTQLVESTSEKDEDIKYTETVFDDDLYRGDIKGNASFVFNAKEYSLDLDAAWMDGDIFYRRSFLLKKDSLAILLDGNTEIFRISTDGVNYKLMGEGKDMKFSQDFNPTNEAIRTNSRPIILFKKDSVGVLRFFDVAKCVGYTMEGETRKVIIFKLSSLLRFKDDGVI